jgi:hypothetical protein
MRQVRRSVSGGFRSRLFLQGKSSRNQKFIEGHCVSVPLWLCERIKCSCRCSVVSVSSGVKSVDPPSPLRATADRCLLRQGFGAQGLLRQGFGAQGLILLRQGYGGQVPPTLQAPAPRS